MTWEFEAHWRAWREEDEPESELIVPSVSHGVIDTKNGQELAEMIVWQQASNDHAYSRWEDGVVIVQIIEPNEVAGIYGVEIERSVRTHAYPLSPDECEQLLADTLCQIEGRE